MAMGRPIWWWPTPAPGNVISVLLGNGDGTFQVEANFTAGMNPQSVVVGDLNGDGVLDLAVANIESGDVSVLLGKGDGTVLTALNFAVGSGPKSGPASVAIGDFDGDGVPDLAVANSGLGGVPPFETGNISVLLGKGDGTFQSAVNFAAGTNPFSVVVGDFNGDGVPDLAIANFGSNNISVLLGNGNGSFQEARNFSVGIGPMSIATGDFNGDGVPDLAVANFHSNDVSLLLGKGDGTFQTAISVSVGNGPFSLAVGDVNSDRALDLLVATADGVSVRLGNGDGTFLPPRIFPAGFDPVAVAVGDFNGDGVPDLAVANLNALDASVLLGNGDGTFQAALNFGVASNPISLAVGDFNGDGLSDVAVANFRNVSVLLNNTVSPRRVAVAIKPRAAGNRIDPNSTGHIRVAILSVNGFDATTVLAETVRFGPTGTEAAPIDVVVRDIDGDGTVDLVLRFAIDETGIRCGQKSAVLKGRTSGGELVQGSDFIKTIRCKQ